MILSSGSNELYIFSTKSSNPLKTDRISIRALVPTQTPIRETNEIIFNSPIIHKLFGEKCCSIWPASHFIMYSIIGYVSPKYFYLWFLLGILWELFEFCIGNTFYKDKIKKNNDIKFEYGDIWMNGSFKDILFNTLGLMFGIFIHNIVNKKY